MNKVLKFFECLFISILIIMAILVIYIFIQTKINPNKIPSVFGYKPFIVLSGSMEKEIIKGDLVIVKEVSISELKEKDIIAFREKEGYVVTHRIVSIEKVDGKYKIITKGDNNSTSDSGYVLESDIEGVYKYKIRGAGKIVIILQKPITLIFTLIVILVGGFGFIILDNYSISFVDKRELEEKSKKTNRKRIDRKND